MKKLYVSQDLMDGMWAAPYVISDIRVVVSPSLTNLGTSLSPAYNPQCAGAILSAKSMLKQHIFQIKLIFIKKFAGKSSIL